MFQVDTKSNRFKSTVGASLVLLLSLNLGIIVHSYSFSAPYEASKVLTYFIVFTASMIFTMYKLVDILQNPSKKYLEGLILGTSSASIILMYLPSLTFEPLMNYFPSLLELFFTLYLLSVALIAIFVAGIVRGSELYASDSGTESEFDFPESSNTTTDTSKTTSDSESSQSNTTPADENE